MTAQSELEKLADLIAHKLRPHVPTEGEAVEMVAAKLSALPAHDRNGMPINQNGAQHS